MPATPQKKQTVCTRNLMSEMQRHLAIRIPMLVAILIVGCLPNATFAAPIQVDVAEKQEEESEEPKKGEDKPQEEPVVAEKPVEVPELDPQVLRIELWEGTKIVGKIQVDTIRLVTDFGALDIPINRIRNIYPGFNSYPKLKEELEGLVTKLGDKDFDVREAAQQELANRGLLVENFLSESLYQETLNAEQKKRLSEVVKQMQTYREELEYDGEQPEQRALVNEDVIVTDQFSVLGKIELAQFEFQTRFGELKVSLQDIKQGDRDLIPTREQVRRIMSVKADAFFQRKPYSTGIRVKKGDKISMTASGTVNWTNWSRVSGPEGLSNYGNYQGVSAGGLAARIGSSGKLIKVGDRATFVAQSSGMLYLGVAMTDNYANQSSYRWSGNFRVRFKMQPKTK